MKKIIGLFLFVLISTCPFTWALADVSVIKNQRDSHSVIDLRFGNKIQVGNKIKYFNNDDTIIYDSVNFIKNLSPDDNVKISQFAVNRPIMTLNAEVPSSTITKVLIDAICDYSLDKEKCKSEYDHSGKRIANKNNSCPLSHIFVPISISQASCYSSCSGLYNDDEFKIIDEECVKIGCSNEAIASGYQKRNNTLSDYNKTCYALTCNEGFILRGTDCLPEHNCNIGDSFNSCYKDVENAIAGSITCNSDANWGSCVITACKEGFKVNADASACEEIENYCDADVFISESCIPDENSNALSGLTSCQNNQISCRPVCEDGFELNTSGVCVKIDNYCDGSETIRACNGLPDNAATYQQECKNNLWTECKILLCDDGFNLSQDGKSCLCSADSEFSCANEILNADVAIKTCNPQGSDYVDCNLIHCKIGWIPDVDSNVCVCDAANGFIPYLENGVEFCVKENDTCACPEDYSDKSICSISFEINKTTSEKIAKCSVSSCKNALFDNGVCKDVGQECFSDCPDKIKCRVAEKTNKKIGNLYCQETTCKDINANPKDNCKSCLIGYALIDGVCVNSTECTLQTDDELFMAYGKKYVQENSHDFGDCIYSECQEIENSLLDPSLVANQENPFNYISNLETKYTITVDPKIGCVETIVDCFYDNHNLEKIDCSLDEFQSLPNITMTKKCMPNNFWSNCELGCDDGFELNNNHTACQQSQYFADDDSLEIIEKNSISLL